MSGRLSLGSGDRIRRDGIVLQVCHPHVPLELVHLDASPVTKQAQRIAVREGLPLQVLVLGLKKTLPALRMS